MKLLDPTCLPRAIVHLKPSGWILQHCFHSCFSPKLWHHLNIYLGWPPGVSSALRSKSIMVNGIELSADPCGMPFSIVSPLYTVLLDSDFYDSVLPKIWDKLQLPSFYSNFCTLKQQWGSWNSVEGWLKVYHCCYWDLLFVKALIDIFCKI